MSTILSEKKTLSPWAKGGIGLGAGALLLVLVGLLSGHGRDLMDAQGRPVDAVYCWCCWACCSPPRRRSSRW